MILSSKFYAVMNVLLYGRMVTHAIELLTAGNDQSEILLHEVRQNLGVSIEELHRLVYAQVLASHQLTWQVGRCFVDEQLNVNFFLTQVQSPHMWLIDDALLSSKRLSSCRLHLNK